MTKIKKVKFDRDEVYNHYIQSFSDELNNDEINDYIDKIEFLYNENDDEDFNFLKNQDLLEIDDLWSNYWSKEMKDDVKNSIKIRYK